MIIDCSNYHVLVISSSTPPTYSKMLNASLNMCLVILVMIMTGRTFGDIDHEAQGISEPHRAQSSDSSVPMAKFIDENSRDLTIEGEPDTRYIIEDVKIGDLQTKVLKNKETGEYAQIVTDLGGRIEDLVLRGSHGMPRSVLLTHHNNVTAIKENTWWKNAILLPYANRIDGVKFNKLAIM